MRHTPKLLALEPIQTTKRTSSKEAIHKFFSMYYNGDSFNPSSKFEKSNNNQDTEMPQLHKSLTTTSLFRREKSNVSMASSSIKSSKTINNNIISVSNTPNNKVKFHSQY